jgi:hypothetical protein
MQQAQQRGRYAKRTELEQNGLHFTGTPNALRLSSSATDRQTDNCWVGRMTNSVQPASIREPVLSSKGDINLLRFSAYMCD